MNKLLQVKERINENISIVSFDLFDTLIYRKNHSLTDIFRLCSVEFSNHCITDVNVRIDESEFHRLRVKITNQIKRSPVFATGEPDLVLVYREMYLKVGVPLNRAKAYAKKMEEYEFYLDVLTLDVIEGATELLKELELSYSLYVITDIYYSEERIKELLSRFEIAQYIKKTYVSSACKLTKSTGRLYDLYLDDINCSAYECVHVGDNYVSDIENAKKAGLNAIFVPFLISSESHEESSCSNKSLRSGVCYSFIAELLEFIHANDIDKVFFMSRDTVIFKDLFKKISGTKEYLSIFQNSDEAVSVHELCVNRKLAAILDIESPLENPSSLVNILCERSGMEDLCINDLFHYLGKNKKEEKFFSNRMPIMELTELLRQDKKLSEQLDQLITDKQNQLVEYLRSIGLMDECKKLIVDIGYSGGFCNSLSTYGFRQPNFGMGGQVYFTLFASGYQFHKNAISSKPLIKYVSPEIIQYENLPYGLVKNFCWLEVDFQDEERGSLKGYDGVTPVFEKKVGYADNDFVGFNMEEMLHFINKGHRAEAVSKYLYRKQNPTEDDVQYYREKKFNKGYDEKENNSIIMDISTVDMLNIRKIKTLIGGEYWYCATLNTKIKKIIFYQIYFLYKLKESLGAFKKWKLKGMNLLGKSRKMITKRRDMKKASEFK